MPPSGFSKHAIKGALQFVQGCYKDLLQEVQSGKHKSYEAGIKFEIKQIDRALTQLHINRKGKITRKRKAQKK